ncbi:MAG: hypothetical protein D6702_05715 [Planctomycetota bacterium]|nr:MAG: hypothetical protein D6702_05715 [Planctomycetota bacterium]
MTGSPAEAWTEENAEATLRRLQEDFPGYTPNELYAIWCVQHDRVPLDVDGKVILEQWAIAGEEDGRYLPCGPFKVSRALYGRAKKAKKGERKPAVKRRAATGVSASAAAAAGLQAGGPLSPRALEFAKAYDRAAKLIDAIVLRRHEIADFTAELREVRPVILEELAAASPEAGELLRELGVLAD